MAPATRTDTQLDNALVHVETLHITDILSTTSKNHDAKRASDR